MRNVGIQRVDIHSDHNRFRGDKMVDVIKFSKKIISFSYQAIYVMLKRLENEINISRNMLRKCPLRWNYRSVWGPYVMDVIFVYQLCSVEYVAAIHVSVCLGGYEVAEFE